MRWNFIDTGFRPGKFNMEFDELLADRGESGGAAGTLRVYGWHPPAVSTVELLGLLHGWNQRMRRCHNHAAHCRQVFRVAKLKVLAVRFSGVVFPGETIVTEMWTNAATGSAEIIVQARTKERGEIVISAASATVGT